MNGFRISNEQIIELKMQMLLEVPNAATMNSDNYILDQTAVGCAGCAGTCEGCGGNCTGSCVSGCEEIGVLKPRW